MGLNCAAAARYMSLAAGPNGRTWGATWVGRRTSSPGSGTHLFGPHLEISFNHQWSVYLDGADNSVHLAVREDGSSYDYNLFTAALNTDYAFKFVRDHAGGQVVLKYSTDPSSGWTGTVTHTVVDFVADDALTVLNFGNIDDLNQEDCNWKLFTVVPTDNDARDECRYRNVQHNTGSIYGNWKFLTGALTTDSSAGAHTLTQNGSPAFVTDPAMVVGEDPSSNLVVEPGVGQLDLTGFEPTFNAAGPGEVAPATGQLDLTGQVPTILTPQSVTSGLGQLDLTGFEPTIVTAGGIAVATDTGALTVTGLAPIPRLDLNYQTIDTVSFVADALTIEIVLAPDPGDLQLTGFAPTISAAVGVLSGAGQLDLTGFAPTVAATAVALAEPGVGQLDVTGFAPVVTASSPTPAGVLVLPRMAVVQGMLRGLR